ncbi:AAA domain-containing protein [Pseudactinotalea sp. HY160]|uniref:AAA family ATPase n=1 Tax=Pseudactinotalea sp. HY160 TaxID=2654490 RepID=UPI00128BF54E|nr:MoxR family ATPase [Pseudactinotalea sp. HY160]MPV49640.1 AAA domain-containing protein [Pseudactinotalea sp. HY160]
MRSIASIDDVGAALDSAGYLSEEGLSTITYLAIAMGRPLLLEGEPGAGKTALAESLAGGLGVPLIRLQCYEGIDASQALYDWDFTKQILHLRALEAAAVTGRDGPGGEAAAGIGEIETSLFDERFLLARPILRSLREGPCVLLIDEIDRADDEFEAFLLEVLSTNQVSIPELGTIRAEVAPIVVMTSNCTRELHDALKRRCLYHWIDHPGLEREVAIVRRRLPGVSERLARRLAGAVQTLRADERLVKPPGVAETLDWAAALAHLGRAELDLATAAATVGAVCKHRGDVEVVRASLDRLLRN